MVNELSEYIYLLVKKIWENEVIPEYWKTTIICVIYKMGIENCAVTTEV